MQISTPTAAAGRRWVAVLMAVASLTASAAPRAFAQQPPSAARPAASHALELNPSAPVLRALPIPPVHANPVATAVGLRYRGIAGVQISPDAKNARLLVMAPPHLQRQIADEVQSLIPTQSQAGQVRQAGLAFDAPATGGPLRMRLQGIGWGGFEDALQKVCGGRLPVTTSRNGELATFQLVDQPLEGTVIEVDRRENAVTVVAAEPTLPGWRKMIHSLDSSGAPAGSVTELLRLENAEPAPIQRAIRLLAGLQTGDSAAVAAAPAAAHARLLAANFPQQPPAGSAAPQAGGPAQPPADAAAEDAGAGLIGDTQIQFVPELGIIIVRGARRDVERVMEVIRQIEEQSIVTQPDVEVYQLKYINSQAVEELLDELYEETLAARQGDISITALDKPNAVLLIGRKEALASVKDLIAQIDQPVTPSSELRVFRLEHASAIDAETTVRGFFVNAPGTDEDPRPGLGTRVRVIADYRTNSLVVQASPRDMLEVTRLVEQLDVQDVPAQSQLKVFQLRHALAEDLAPILQTAITGGAEVEGETQVTTPSTTLSILAVDAEGGRVLDSGILAGAVITAEPNANAIVVRAPSTSMALIGELIRQLDQAPGVESLVKVFTIENGDAMQLVTALQQLFGTETTTQGVGAANVLGLAPTTAGTETSLVPLRFAADMRTNSIIASGSANDLEVVESLMLRLDTEGFATRITEVIWLRNQGALEVATAIQAFVADRRIAINTIQQFQQGGLGPFDLLERDLVVVPEPVSNSLILSVSPRLYDTVRRMIDQLDRRPPMVLIKVLIAEVSLTDGFEFGAELGVQDDLLFDRSIAGTQSVPGFNFNNAGTPNLSSAGRDSLAERTVSTFGLGTSSGTFGYGGFVLSAASDSVSLLLRTLQDAGRLQILSRPQLMTMDNTVGVVQVGSLVPRITSITATNIGGQTFGTEDLNVGLILEVRPRVGRDGLIVMEVNAIRSALDQVSQGIPVGFSPTGEPIFSPIIQQTQAESVITAFSGQTVVYGGLIQKSRSQRSRRVPYLSNIPVLGNFFRFDQEIESRDELLVILTPMIVSGEEDLQYVKATETARMSWCLADVVEMHGDEGLGGGHGLWGPAISPVIYPDLQPTVDDFEPIHIPSNVPVELHQPDGTVCPPGSSQQNVQLPDGMIYSPPSSGATYAPPSDPTIYLPPSNVPYTPPSEPYVAPSAPSVRRQIAPPQANSVLEGEFPRVEPTAPVQPMSYTAPVRMPRVN